MKSREFITFTGEPDEEWEKSQAERTHEVIAYTSEKNPEMERVLDDIDLDAIRGMFLQMATRTEIDPEKAHFVPRERIHFNSTYNLLGAYSVDSDTIMLNPKGIDEARLEHGIDGRVLVLTTLIHEEGHAVSKLTCVGGTEFTSKPDTKNELTAGYSKTKSERTQDMDSSVDYYGLFEEGVTELLAEKLTVDYLEQHPSFVPKETVEEFKQYLEDDTRMKTYMLPVTFVEALIEKLAHETGVSRETVFGAIIRGKMEGENLADDEFRKLAAEIVGPKVFPRLESLNVVDQELTMMRLMDDMKIKDINPKLWERIEKRFKLVSSEHQANRKKLSAA